jgi:hypothetical protein
MVWKFMVAQILAMVFLAMILLGIRDMIRHRSDAAVVRGHLFFIFITLALLAWSIWLIAREAPHLKP